jgi:hypothetical protein
MSNSTMAGLTANFDAALEKQISDRLSVVGEASLEVYLVGVRASEIARMVAEALYDGVTQLSIREPTITKDELIEWFDWLVDARIWYVLGGKGEFHPRDIEYPAMLGPVLAAIGVYRDPIRNIAIYPVLEKCPSGLQIEPRNGDSPVVSGKMPGPKALSKLISFCRLGGVPTVFGLPMAKTVDSDELYRLDVVDGIVRGASTTAPTALTVFSRVLLKLMYLSSLYGNGRVSYVAVDHLRTSILDLVLRNISGPRVNTT